MKKLAAILCLSALATGAYAQGLVNFFNNPNTLISAGGTATAGVANGYYFALLTAPVNSVDPLAFTFSGLIGAQQGAPGRFNGGNGVAVTGWLPGTDRAFRVVGWSADNGATFNPAWILAGTIGGYVGTPTGFFGASAIAPAGTAGGGPQSLPNLNTFGGTQGIQAGFNLVPVPEPTTLALAGLGAAALLIFRRRK